MDVNNYGDAHGEYLAVMGQNAGTYEGKHAGQPVYPSVVYVPRHASEGRRREADAHLQEATEALVSAA